MKIKVCGMRNAENIAALGKLSIDYMGLIFYEKSSRFVEDFIQTDLPNEIKKVGVFVNAEKDYILDKVNKYDLKVIQLHGSETPEFCDELKKYIPIIKAFSIENVSDLEQATLYLDVCDYFLFDTKTPQYGGSGQKFDWSILEHYKGTKPFFLSGGISEDDVKIIKKINHPAFEGIDLNSKFEIEPALKDITKLEKFINDIQS